jgi:hypothetical protein
MKGLVGEESEILVGLCRKQIKESLRNTYRMKEIHWGFPKHFSAKTLNCARMKIRSIWELLNFLDMEHA